ncbi:MAG: hypothetical protein K0Q63_3572 [Paenibacillus sp.]|nr:hypothetical protein [Paenibacillus sp.]
MLRKAKNRPASGTVLLFYGYSKPYSTAQTLHILNFNLPEALFIELAQNTVQQYGRFRSGRMA